MRTPWINNSTALRARMAKPFQVQSTAPEAGMPPYMESFLAHLRLLIGVPFDYLVPDARLLPDESIRFFYLDRSWTDRLVDGAVAVGKIGTREQAHHQAHGAAVHQQLDQTERIVRKLQINVPGIVFSDLKTSNDANQSAGEIVTGFLLRSAAVAGWPQMDVRAYVNDIQDGERPFDPSDSQVMQQQLQTLRLELLSPSVMIALFQGIPKLVILEEPHHGVQFGILDPQQNGNFRMYIRDTSGYQIKAQTNNAAEGWVADEPITIPVPVRSSNRRVIRITALRDALQSESAKTLPEPMPQQTGSASFAQEVLQPPWRQRFEGTVDHAGEGQGGSTGGRFTGTIKIGANVQVAAIQSAYQKILSTAQVGPVINPNPVENPVAERTEEHHGS
jgi:hypothetical protein